MSEDKCVSCGEETNGGNFCKTCSPHCSVLEYYEDGGGRARIWTDERKSGREIKCKQK